MNRSRTVVLPDHGMTMRHRFNCEGCGADVVVDGNVREGILEEGCPLCGAATGAGDFEELDGGVTLQG